MGILIGWFVDEGEEVLLMDILRLSVIRTIHTVIY